MQTSITTKVVSEKIILYHQGIHKKRGVSIYNLKYNKYQDSIPDYCRSIFICWLLFDLPHHFFILFPSPSSSNKSCKQQLDATRKKSRKGRVREREGSLGHGPFLLEEKGLGERYPY
jgi:hypothetical protein